MAEHAVVIAGGGPTGLVLAGELALAGVDVVIFEHRRYEKESRRDLGTATRELPIPNRAVCDGSDTSQYGA
jgi:3-(3-hydroxy-phenyl)propionate hydroxylase